jgi:hypothetical protein
VLHQGDELISYFSRQLASHHAKLAAYERELIGLVQVVRHWCPYLWRHTFIIKTDHFSMKFLLDQRLSTILQHQWASKLIGFDFQVEYKPGSSNIVVDALSRRDTEATTKVAALSDPAFAIFDALRVEATSSTELQQLRDEVTSGARGEQWHVVDGLIMHKGRVYMPLQSPSLPEILAMTHGLGHERTEKTLHCMQTNFFIPSDHVVVRDFVQACLVCQRNKMEKLHPAGLLHPLDVPTMVWADIAIDFIEGLPKVKGKSVILMVVDRFSKAAHFLQLGHPYTVTSVLRVFFGTIVKLHDIPSTIVSDHDSVFNGCFWKELFAMAGVKLQFTSAFHPQADGQSEATNKIIAMYLTGDRPRQWLQWLPWAEYCCNSSFQTSLCTSPFKVVYGRDPPSLRAYSPGEARLSAVNM